LPNTFQSASSNAEKLAYYSLLDKTTFTQNQTIHDGAAKFLGYDGYGSGGFTWDDFQASLEKYKSQQSSALSDWSSLSTYQSIIPTESYQAYVVCLTQNEQGPVLTAVLERQGAQNKNGVYTAFAIHLAFVAGGGSAKDAKVTILSSDPKVTVTPGPSSNFQEAVQRL
jgi:hypothetical protein